MRLLTVLLIFCISASGICHARRRSKNKRFDKRLAEVDKAKKVDPEIKRLRVIAYKQLGKDLKHKVVGRAKYLQTLNTLYFKNNVKLNTTFQALLGYYIIKLNPKGLQKLRFKTRSKAIKLANDFLKELKSGKKTKKKLF